MLLGTDAGGAIAANNASAITIITSTFTSNMAENGGAIFIEEVGFFSCFAELPFLLHVFRNLKDPAANSPCLLRRVHLKQCVCASVEKQL